MKKFKRPELQKSKRLEQVHHCPHCKVEITAYTGLNKRSQVLTDGAFTVCLKCAQIGVFIATEQGGTFEKATPAEVLDYAQRDPETFAQIMLVQQGIGEIQSERARRN